MLKKLPGTSRLNYPHFSMSAIKFYSGALFYIQPPWRGINPHPTCHTPTNPHDKLGDGIFNQSRYFLSFAYYKQLDSNVDKGKMILNPLIKATIL